MGAAHRARDDPARPLPILATAIEDGEMSATGTGHRNAPAEGSEDRGPARRPDHEIGGSAPSDAAEEARLLRFYDRLRDRVSHRLKGRVGDKATDTLLLAPDVFILLVRLFMDPRVPGATRSL